MNLPKVGTAADANLGVAILTDVVFRARGEGGLAFIYRNQPESDVGIDGHIEIVDQKTREATGKLLGVQIKAGTSFFRRRSATGWVVSIRKKATVRYWRQYAVPVVLAIVDTKRREVYWVVVSQGDFEETKTTFKIPVPRAQRLDASAADSIEQLAKEPPPALAAKIQALVKELSDATAGELDRFRDSWREGRRADARRWLQTLMQSPGRLAAVNPVVAARVLRFAAGIELDEEGDIDSARAWAEEARSRDPHADDARIRAALLARGGNVAAALDLLAGSAEPAARTALALNHLRRGDREAARRVLDSVEPTTQVDRAGLWMVRARLAVGDGDLSAALEAVTAAGACDPRSAQVRLLRAMLTYLEGVAPDGWPDTLPEWPQPLPDELLRRDDTAVAQFRAAASTFRQLEELDWTAAERRYLETWRLAALCAVAADRPAAARYAGDVLARDTAQAYVVLWSALESLPIDLGPHFLALQAELERAPDIGLATVYLAARFAAGRTDGVVEWLNAWRARFEDAGAPPLWTLWRGRASVAAGDLAGARAFLARLGNGEARALEAEILEAEARLTRDYTALLAHLETEARASGDPMSILGLCRGYARAGRWAAILPHLDLLMDRLPTPAVVRLALFTLYRTGDWPSCAELLDEALAQAPPGPDMVELLRIRADVRRRTGNLQGALDDMLQVVSQPGQQASTPDLLVLLQSFFFAGRLHELATYARQLRHRDDLGPADALMIAEVLVHDDRPSAREFWRQAKATGLADSDVPAAVGLGYQLGLDAEMREVVARMAALAEAGSVSVQRFTLDEVIAMRRDWLKGQERVLGLYRRGETATHIVADFLNRPLVHFYHLLPDANEAQSTRRHQFPLQLRAGGRRFPQGITQLAGPGRLAMDISSLLLAAHVGILDQVEAQFAPLRLPSHSIGALHEQRDKLKPHQPSRIDITKDLLAAERQGHLRPWAGELPLLDPAERSAAGNWWEWVALLERARAEAALVLDLPLELESPHGRPTWVAGPARLERLVTVAEFRAYLKAIGALPADLPQGGEDDDEAPAPQGTPVTSSSGSLTRGALVYMTDAGAEALADSGLLRAAASVLQLRVNPADQDARRAQIEALSEVEDHAGWLEALIRRVSDGLSDGKYSLLPSREGAIARPEGVESPNASTPPAVEAEGVADGLRDQSATAEPESRDSSETKQGESVDVSEDDARESSGHRLSLTLRCMADLVALPAGTVDAVWIDDRWVNGHRLAGTAPMCDLLDVLEALESAGRITRDRLWGIILQLRSANARILPLSAAEILVHLQRAPTTEEGVTETPALRVLRQYAAAMLEDADKLRVPPPDQIATGNAGELDVVRSYASAVREALLGLWRQLPDEPSAAAQARVEAQSEWLIGNMYVDLALLRSRAIPWTLGPDAGVSAFNATILLLSCMELLQKKNTLVAGETDALSAAYAKWVYENVVHERAARDGAFRAELLARLRATLANVPEGAAGGGAEAMIARLLNGRTFDALPEALQDALNTDPELMEWLGRVVISSMGIGRWHVATGAFANAAAALLAGEGSSEGAAAVTVRDAMDPAAVESMPIPILGTEPPLSLTLTRSADGGFALTSPDGTETVLLRDAALGVLAQDEATRREACEACRRDVDMSVTEWAVTTETIIGIEDPGARLEALYERRQRTMRHRYTEMAERWRREHAIRSEDLHASPPIAVLRHLRVAVQAGQIGTELPEETWQAAARTLIDEEGVPAAFERLASLPIRMPGVVSSALSDLTSEELRAFARRLLRGPSSPLRFVHSIRLLASMGDRDHLYLRVARRLVRRLVEPLFRTQVELLRLVAAEAYSGMAYSTDEAAPLADESAQHGGPGSLIAQAERLIASWHHAHRFVANVQASRGNALGLVEWLEARSASSVRGLFDVEELAPHDVAHPALVRTVPLLASALQYAGEGTKLLAGADDMLARLRPFFAQEGTDGRMPQVDLLRDLRSHPNVLGSWLEPVRETDGSLLIGSAQIVPASAAPKALREEALRGIAHDATEAAAWGTLQLVNGADALVGADAHLFREVVQGLDIPELLIALGAAAGVAAERLARQAQVDPDAQWPTRLREQLLAVEGIVQQRTSSTEASGKPSAAGGDVDLTDLQVAVVQALYILAHAEPTPALAMAALTRDLTRLSSTDPVYLHRVRSVVERLVLSRPLIEAEACLPLLLEARAA